jgi:glucan phosphorylase
MTYLSFLCFLIIVNDGDYLNAVSEQSLAENVTRVLYPNDNVRKRILFDDSYFGIVILLILIV